MGSRITSKDSNGQAGALDLGRESFRNKAWGTAYSQLSAADRESALEPDPLVELAQSALLVGRDSEGADYLIRAHQGFNAKGNNRSAARCAFWLGFNALLNGEVATAGGWLSRANRLLAEHPDCVERGYLLLPIAMTSFHARDAVTAYETFVQAGAIGQRFDDKDLATLGLQGQGRALIRQGNISRGVELLDEAMIAITAGEVSALTAGGVYCSVLDACGEIFDLQRAHEWTAALDAWCNSQPDLVPYRGHCLIRRSELMQLHGAWPDALEEAQRATEWLSRPTPKPFVGSAFYQVGEVHRLRGLFSAAEQAYQQAGKWGHSHGPGLARLRLAQGQIEAAHAAIRKLVEEVHEFAPRARALDAYVEVALAANDPATARAALDELLQVADHHNVPMLRAMSSRAAGAVLLSEGNAHAAMAELRLSWSLWCELRAPYETARTQILIAQAFRILGDEENASAELGTARNAFEKLGASVDLRRADKLLSKEGHLSEGPLTEREVQVLRLVASGITNRAIAQQLCISEKTVARHLSNIFTKLGLYSRTAATAYAYDNKLV